MSKPVIHRCEHCTTQCQTKNQLNTHKKIHLSTFDFKCNFCSYASKFKKSLDDHIRSHLKERPYKCKQPNCNLAFTKTSTLNRHQLVHNKGDESLLKFKCSTCNYKTGRKEIYNEHLKTHSDFKEFACDLCPYKSKYRNHIRRHHKSVHLKLRPFKCQKSGCNFACNDRSYLNQHELVHKKEDNSLLKFKCLNCGYKTGRKRNLSRHSRVHSSSTLKPFKCQQPNCKFSCRLESSLTSHAKVHGDDQPFVCTFAGCAYKTKWKESLRRHEMVHRGERPYKCTFCSFTCSQQGSLIGHIRGHTGETPYPCKSCPYRGRTSSELLKHSRRSHSSKDLDAGHSSIKMAPEASLKCKNSRCVFIAENDSGLAKHLNAIHHLPQVVMNI